MKQASWTLCVLTLGIISSAVAQEQNERPQFPRFLPPVNSPEVIEGGKVTFRLRAESATNVRFESSDIPNLGFGGTEMKKGEEGVWSLTTEALPSGAYRYNFSVDGVRVIDPVNTSISESNTNVWSLVIVPGSESSDLKDVPHGTVSEVVYQSQSLKSPRRMHIYTPPGYESGEGTFPVLYLLHGAFDCDDSWTTVGRANLILDNLIASGKAKPMIVVMPNGHTGRFSFGQPNGLDQQVDGFVKDFTQDIRPYVETHYRIKNDRAHRAIAGLSMGGAQTLEIAAAQLKDFAHVGVFSSGVFSINSRFPAAQGSSWEERNKKMLDDAELKQGLKTVWFATGKDDFLIETSRGTVKVFKEHGFTVEFQETEGGHTWLNWRDYLADFAPLLFQEAKD